MTTIIRMLAVAALVSSSLVGQAPFRAPRFFDDSRQIVGAGDVDLDGDADLIGIILNNNLTLRFYFNDGSGNFPTVASFNIPRALTSNVLLLDATGDGLSDLVYAAFNSSTGGAQALAVHPRLTPTTFNPTPIFYALTETAFLLEAGDVNADGAIDILIAGVSNNGFGQLVDRLRWAVRTPSGLNLGAAAVLVPTRTSALVVGQIDNLPGVDVAHGSSSSIQVRTTSLLSLTTVGTPGFGTLIDELTYSDIDGDGDDDFVAGNNPVGTYDILYQVALRQPTGGFVLSPLTSLISSPPEFNFNGPFPSRLFVRDLNGDNAVEIFRCTWPTTQRLQILSNNGSGVFSKGKSFYGLTQSSFAPAPFQPRGFVDLTGDGTPDFCAFREIYHNDDVAPAFEPATNPVYQPKAFDMDLDGDLDLVSSLDGKFRLNDGRGTMSGSPFTASIPIILTPGTPLELSEPADFDGDGRLDAIGSRYAFNTFVEHRHLRGVPGLLYLDAGPVIVPQGSILPFKIRGAGQVDGTGPPDVQLDHGALIGIGGGGFNYVSMPWSANGSLQDTADLNSDGLLDALAFTPSTSTLEIFLNNAGTYNLSTALIFPGLVDDTCRFIDLDGNGAPEIVGLFDNATQRLPVVFPLLNLIPQVPIILTPSNQIVRVFYAGDLNGDGRSEIWATSDDINPSRVLCTWMHSPTTLFSFGAPILQAIDIARTAGDFDGDGDIDLYGGPMIWNDLVIGPGAGQRRQYGISSLGTGFIPPTLGVEGLLRSGNIATIRVRDVLPGATGLLTIGTQPSAVTGFPAPGLTGWNLPLIAFLPISSSGAPTGLAGTGTVDIPFGVPSGIQGQRLCFQAGFVDPLTPAGIVVTQGLEIIFGS